MFRVTYEIYTPESVEIGEPEETGFVMPGGWKTDIETALNYSSEDYRMSLREALYLATPDCDCGQWFAETGESRCDYLSGAVERRAIHPPANLTPASYARLKRLMGVLK